LVLSNSPEDRQRATCALYGSKFVETSRYERLGVADNVISGMLPLNGLRHPPVEGASGWYIWAGDTLSADPRFFRPLHASHILEYCPEVGPFLGLAPGWRFLIAGDYQDVWYDPELLDVK
jgi:hypothetical protein